MVEVMPGATLIMLTEQNHIYPDVPAEFIIRDMPLEIANDEVGFPNPYQICTGSISIDRLIKMYGLIKTSAFVRRAQEPLISQTDDYHTVQASCWKAGDKFVLHKTKLQSLC